VTARAPIAAGNFFSVTLAANGLGQFIWSGDLGLETVNQLWIANCGVEIYSEMGAADASTLMPVIARLGAHAHTFTIYTRDVRGWRTGMDTLCAKRELPGPDISVRCAIEEWIDPPAIARGAAVVNADIGNEIQPRLDAEVLRQLREALYETLGPPAVDMGWPIQPLLRQKLWTTWEGWHAMLTADPTACRRFLRLLATADDRIYSGDADLIRVGPKIVRPFLTKPAIFGLAFAACSGHALAPAIKHPGNVVHEALTGHACGVGWIRGRELGPRCASEQAWTTGIVLLSQLREAFQVIEGDARFDRRISDAPIVGTISPGEEPLIIGADEVFIGALEAGEEPVRDYLQSIFRRRSEVLRHTLEEVQDANN
jgi:hypothetical protein